MAEGFGHSPTPWRVDADQDGHWVEDSNSNFVVRHVHGEHPLIVARNAHLIAAAPDLLEAAQSLIVDARARPGAYIHCLPAIDRLQRAVDLAKGEL